MAVMEVLQKVPFALFSLTHGLVSAVYLTKGSLGFMTTFDWPGSAAKTEATVLEDLALSMVCSYEMVLCGVCTLALLRRSTEKTRRIVLFVEATVFSLIGLFHTRLKQKPDVIPLVLSIIAILSVPIQSSHDTDKSKSA